MLSSASNRSFRMPRRALSNRQNQSFPPLITEDGKDVIKLSSSVEPTKILPHSQGTVLSSPSKCSSSTFCAELADGMPTNEENMAAAVPHQIRIGKGDHSYCEESSKENPRNKASGLRSPLMASQLVVNSSMNSVSVMNVSVGPLKASPGDNSDSDRDLDELHDAMTDNMAAQHLLESEKYRESMIIYRKAMRQFVKICDMDNRIVAGVNAASCYRNMSSAACMLKQYDEATKCLALAVAWYLKSHALVTKEAQKSIATLDGKMIDNSMMSPNKSLTSLMDTACIDAMLIEALHYQANVFLEYKGDVAGAFAAHDSVLAHLVELDKLEQWKSASTTLCYLDGVVFTTATESQQTSWLVESLGALGDFFLAHQQFSNTPLALFEKGIDILQNRFEESENKGEDMIRNVSLILRKLSEIYFSRQLHDLAADALHDSASIQLRSPGKPSDDALLIMEKVAAANERAQCYDQARSCYEQIMLARSKYYGTTDLGVSKSLFDIGRSIEKKTGPTEESGDILKTANSILALNFTEGVSDLRENIDLMMQLLPNMQHFDRSASVVSDLDKSLSELHLRPNSSYEGPFDKAQIYFNLGRGFTRLEKDSLAATCFKLAMKEAKSFEEKNEESMHLTDERDSSIVLAGETINLNETTKSNGSVVNNDCFLQAKRSVTVPIGSPANKEAAEDLNSFHDPPLLQDMEPSMYFFEDAPSETSCYQPTKRDECCAALSKEPSIRVLQVKGVIPKSAIPSKTKPVSATSEPTNRRKLPWRQIFCPLWSTSLTDGHQSPLNATRESLKPSIRGQRQISHVNPRPRARSKLASTLCTIHESMSFGHENEEMAARPLLHSGDSPTRISIGERGNSQRAISYTTMRRKQYAAV